MFDTANLPVLSQADEQRLLQLMIEEAREARRRWVLRNMPPELGKFYAAAKAYDAGDEGPMEAWVAERVGGPIDGTLHAALKAWMLDEEGRPRGKKIPAFHAFDWTYYHRQRYKTPSHRWYEERGEEVYSNLKKIPGYELMRSLEAYGGEALAQLKAEVGGAVNMAEAAGHYYAGRGKKAGHYERHRRPMLRAVEKVIVDDNRLLRYTRKPLRDTDGNVIGYKIIPNMQRQEGEEFDLFEVELPDLATLEVYDGIEDALDAGRLLDGLIARAGLSTRELEVLGLLRQRLNPGAIAAEFGTERDTVYGQLRDIRKKLRAAS